MRQGRSTEELRSTLQNRAEADAANLFAILDAARSKDIFSRLQRFTSGWVSLYRGEPEESLVEVAPYLVQMHDSGILQWFLAEGWGNSWGLFLTSTQTLEQVRRHFRHFLLVRDEDGKQMYFRFYDPRVLRIYLPTCTAAETRRFFGPIRTFFMESDGGFELVEFSIPVANATPQKSQKSAVGSLLRIRREQLQVFSDAMIRSFDERMFVHLHKFFPKRCQVLGDSEVRAWIKAGIAESAEYDIVAERDVSKYLNLMFTFGRDFAKSAETPWAYGILADALAKPAEKIDRLYAAAKNQMKKEPLA